MPEASSLVRLALGALLVASATASAEPRPAVNPANPPRAMFVRTPGAAAPTTAAVSSRIVYLHRCPLISGCNLRTGTDDSRTDTSSIADGNRILGEFSQSDQVWNELVDCVTTTFAPFNIQITTTNPGNTVQHFENMVGGKISDITSDPNLQNAGGVAPFDCGEIPNAIVYTFDVYGPDPQQLCWTSAQEIAHAFGLEHEFLQKDPLTYLAGDMPKRFRDVSAPCGELEQFAGCRCGGTTQNTYRHIVGMFGPGAPTPPDVAFNRPADGGTVQPGYRTVVTAADDVRVEKVELYIDGALAVTATESVGDAFDLVLPALDAGSHTLEARATDVQGVVNTTTITVTLGPACTPSKGCTGDDVCVEGACVPGPDTPGGLGSQCQGDTECLSHQCADGGDAKKYCVEACNAQNSNSCPSGFECLSAGSVCWPSEGGGCCDSSGSSGSSSRGALLLGLGVVLVLSRRRRR